MKRLSPVVPLVPALIALAALALPAFALTGPAVDPNAPCFRWPAVDYDKDGVYDRVDNCPNTREGCIVDKYGCALDSDGDGVCDGVDQCEGTPAGAKVDKTNGCSEEQLGMRNARSTPVTQRSTPPPAPPSPPPPAPVPPPKPIPSHIRLENILFESGSDRLLPESEATLDEVGRELEKYPDLKIEVQGHTDTSGPAALNMKLSQKRAESVRRYLLEHTTLKPENLTAKGYGETRPETKERNQEEKLRNRRVELDIKNPGALPSNVKVDKE